MLYHSPFTNYDFRFTIHYLDTYLGNVEQNDSRKIYRAKPALSKVEGTPSTQRKIIIYGPSGSSVGSPNI